jgi:hypothetical protein
MIGARRHDFVVPDIAEAMQPFDCLDLTSGKLDER